MPEKVAIKNGQSIETDNCIATFIYILSFTVTIFMYHSQLINTEILSDKSSKTTVVSRHIIVCDVFHNSVDAV
jgi:hypothetical protein